MLLKMEKSQKKSREFEHHKTSDNFSSKGVFLKKILLLSFVYFEADWRGEKGDYWETREILEETVSLSIILSALGDQWMESLLRCAQEQDCEKGLGWISL